MFILTFFGVISASMIFKIKNILENKGSKYLKLSFCF